MKKLKVLLFLIILTVGAHAQSNHITFLGIPINSDYLILDSRLKDYGYKITASDESSSQKDYVYEGGIFHDKNYTIMVTCENRIISSVFLLLSDLDYESAISEIADLKFGTVKKHPNYKFKNLPIGTDSEYVVMIEWQIPGNEKEKIIYSMVRLDGDKYAINIVYDNKKIKNKMDDL